MEEKGRHILIGVLAIILGLIIMIFPLISVFAISVLFGISILVIGIYMIVKAFPTWQASKGASIGYLIFGILAIFLGIGLTGKVLAFSFLVSFLLYFVGFFLIISGIFALFAGENSAMKGAGGLGIILGILYIILGAYAYNPIYLAIIIGIWLIIDGIVYIFMPPKMMEKATTT
jgi:membrane protein HdeD